MKYTIDIEPTNRCNASCYFCPRDKTPHQGLMSPEVFAKALERSIEYREIVRDELHGGVGISLCGLGEPLINKHLPEFVADVTAAGFPCTVSSNGGLLDEARGRALLDAGLRQIYINAGEDEATYEEIYELPYQRTIDNVVRFAEMADGRCEVQIVLVDHRSDPAHLERMKDFWRARGLDRFVVYDIINRGGALFVDHMQFESIPQLRQATAILDDKIGTPICGAPFGYLFIGYDGQYYLCCSDWTKLTPMGSVHDESFLSVTRQKVAFAQTRQPVCATCNLDPTNRLTEQLQAEQAGDSDAATTEALIASICEGHATVTDILERLEPLLGAPDVAARRAARPRIPLSSS